MRFERVGGDLRIVSPYLMQKRFAADGRARAFQKVQDVGFLLGQVNPLVAVRQRLGVGVKNIAPYARRDVFVRLTLAQERMHARHQRGEAERFRHGGIGAVRLPILLGGSGQKNDRRRKAGLTQIFAKSVTVFLRRRSVDQDEFETRVSGPRTCLVRRRGLDRKIRATQAYLLGQGRSQNGVAANQEHTLWSLHRWKLLAGRLPYPVSPWGCMSRWDCTEPLKSMTQAGKSANSAGEIVGAAHRVERAAGDFRRGVPVLVEGAPGQSVLALSAETLNEAVLASCVSRFGAPAMVITHARAATLKIPLYTQDVVVLDQELTARARDLRAIADPAKDLEFPMKGPFSPRREKPPVAAQASVRLAKLAGLLPATIVFAVDDAARARLAADNAISTVDQDAVLGFAQSAADTLVLVTRAHVPLEGAEDAELAAFRPADGGPEHFAVIIGKDGAVSLRPPGPVLTRLHSECFTGDFLGSLKCDCGDQLRGAVQEIAKAGGGILLYLAQEGRGIGLMNKLRAYRLQDEGFDTLDANTRLGFEADERLYDIAARMLTLLGYRSVRLLTNNPEKMKALESAGIKVVERVAHAFPENPHNRFYLRTKADRGGHLL